MHVKPKLGTRQRVPKVGFRRFTFREQIEIIHLYLKKHPEGVRISDIIRDTGSSWDIIEKRIKQMRRLGLLRSRHLGANNLRLYYYVDRVMKSQ